MENDNQNQGAETAPKDEIQPPAEDRIKNLQAEFSRKLDNTNAQLQAVLAALQQSKPAPAAVKVEEVDIDSLWFDKPKEAARRIKEETATEIRRELAAQQQAQFKQAQTINALVSDFPELSDQNSDLTRKAVEIYNAMPEDERQSPVAYKAAVKEAALELDVKPKSKRKAASKEDDSFALGGAQRATRPAQSGEREKAQEFLAEQFGLKLTPEIKERLKKGHGRKSYGSWE